MPADDRPTRYPLLAEAALRGEDIGSSAGGEQPKFTAMLWHGDGVRAVVVKFSERTGTPAGQRWADLLRCEHLAGEVLRAHGIASAETRLLSAGGRVFLESTRFDRTPARGRRGLVSLAALDAAFHGHGRRDWWRLAEQLRHDGWIDAGDAHALALRGWFGALIANSDMHLGNASLVLADAPPLALAPSYDMLPMAFRPASSGEVVAREADIPLPLPEQREHWQAAAAMAADFWRQVAGASGVSAGFRDIASLQLRKLQAAMARVR
jgi:serine/threonine protein kinase HipA of HipAB toxin-antitoxin module